MNREQSPVLGPDGQKLPARLSFWRRTAQKGTVLRRFSKYAALGLLTVSGWLTTVVTNLESITDWWFGRRAEVKIADVDTRKAIAFVVMTNEGGKSTFVTHAIVTITDVAKVTFDTRRFGLRFLTSRINASATYPLALDATSLVTPVNIELNNFGHALAEGEADAFNLDFADGKWLRIEGNDTESWILAFKAQVTLLYDDRQAVSRPFVVRTMDYELEHRAATEEELREKGTEAEDAVRDLYEAYDSPPPPT